MCLIIYSPFGSTIPKEHIEEAALTNPDGIGISYQVEPSGQVFIRKYLKMEEFLKEWGPRLADPNYIMVVHLRYATQGTVKLDNCHPFIVQKEYAVHHNGCLSGFSSADDKTDSELFCISVLEKDNLEDKTRRSKIALKIGGSKLVVHHANEVYIINEKLGHWLNGCWYSNHTYVSYKSLSLFEELLTEIPCTNCLAVNDETAADCWFCFQPLYAPSDFVLKYMDKYMK